MNLSKFYIVLLLVSVAFILTSCDSSDVVSEESSAISSNAIDLQKVTNPDSEEINITVAILDQINNNLASENSNFRVFKAEFITADGNDEMGNTIIANDVGNKQLDFDFVPNDSRRVPWSGPVAGSTDDIRYVIDQVDAVPLSLGLTAEQTTQSIVNAMATWNNLNCSDLAIDRNPDVAADLGFIAASFGLGGSFAVAGDVQHAGFTDINFAGGVLGVAFTLVFIDGAGNTTDIDGNGKGDVAFREIYYDPSWVWGIDGSDSFVDVESIALHEAGHGLSQAHFGKVMIKKNGEIQASPRAIMNAVYLGGSERDLYGTDNGGHCSNWGQWPNN